MVIAVVDARQLLFMSSDARSRFASQSPRSLVGTAIVVNSEVQTMLANLYLNVARPKNPTKVFFDENAALVGLRERLGAARQKRA